MMSLPIFWDVDTQVDFIDPAGKLYVPGAETIVPHLERLTRWAGEHRILIVSSACAHRPHDPEFSLYPPHCLVGTPGQQKIPETLLPHAFTIPNHPVDLPQDLSRFPQLVIEKQQLDVFTNPNVEAVVSALSPRREVILYGVVTEICVARAARGLLDRGFRVRVLTDAVRHLDSAQAKEFFDDARNHGAQLATADATIAELSRVHVA